jgi:hypothetical protein
VHLLDEVAQHPLGGVEVRDDAVRSGRIATMFAGVRPIIRLAPVPTATIPPVVVSIATTLGSLSTIPRPRTYTSVLAVPRSTARSRPRNDQVVLVAMGVEAFRRGWDGRRARCWRSG